MDCGCEKPTYLCRVIVFALVALLGGILFPFRKSMSELAFQVALLPFAAIFLYLVLVFFRSDLLRIPAPVIRSFRRATPEGTALAVIVAFVLLSFGLMLYENRLFADFGYHLGVSAAASAAGAVLCFAISLRFAFKGRYLSYAVLLAMLAIQLLSIRSFPLHEARSDMMLLIEAAGERFLSGSSPYSSYVINDTVMLTYLPGLWLPYLPSILLGLDVRFTNVACLTAAFLVFHRTCRRSGLDRNALGFAAVFFLNPWLGFRHEIYLPVFLLQLSLSFSFLLRGRLQSAIAVFAWAVCSYQYSWVVLPLFLALLYHQHGRKAVLKAIAWTAASILALIVPFLVWAPGEMIQGVLGAWSDVYQIETFNLSFWILRIVPLHAIKIVQALLLAGLYTVAIPRTRDFRGFFMWSTASTLLFMLTSQLIWHYFFLLPPLYMLYHAISPGGPIRPATEQQAA